MLDFGRRQGAVECGRSLAFPAFDFDTDAQIGEVTGVQASEGLPRSIRSEDLFRNLAAGTRQAFEGLQERLSYPQGAALFEPDQAGSGIFVVRTGSVKVAHSFAADKTASAIIAFPGEILGLAAAVSGQNYESAAQTLEPSQIGFVGRENLLEFLHQHNEVAFRIVELLSEALHVTLDRNRLRPPRGDVRH